LKRQIIMERILKSFSRCFLVISLQLITCSDLPYSPYDRAYKGDYSFDLQINKDSLYPFTPYLFHFRSGSDSYFNFSFYTDPPGVMDPFFFHSRKSSDTMGFYFTRPFSGNIVLTGLRRNECSDTFQIELSVNDPVKIKYIRVISIPDTIKSFFISGDQFDSEQVKNVIWFLDTIAVDTLSVNDTCAFPVYCPKDLILSAIMSDWQGYRFSTSPCTVLNRQFQKKIKVTEPNHPLTIGDTVVLLISLESNQVDSGSLKIESLFDTIIVPTIFLIARNDLFSVSIGIVDRPGIFPVKIFYTDSEGIVYEHIHYLTVEPDFRKRIVYGISMVPPVIYDRQQVTFSVYAGLSPSGNACNRFYWSFDGDFQWDTVSSKPTITSSFTGDSLHLLVCCSDSTGFFSDVYRAGFPIEPGLPVVYDAAIKDQKLYAGKPFMVRIWAEDNPGGMIDSFKIKLTDLSGDSMIFISDQSSLMVTTDTGFFGDVILKAEVKDSAGHWSVPFIMQDTLEISRGFPGIITLKFLDTVWLAQPAMLLIEAIDYNGILSMITVSWDESFTDTVICSESRFSEVFRYTFNSPVTGQRVVKVDIIDNNGLLTSDSIIVFVHDLNLVTE